MARPRLSVFRRSSIVRLALVTVLLLHLPPATLVSGGQARPTQRQREDPCQQIFEVPGKAKGLHDQCGSLGGGSGVARGDFNGDLIADVAIGVPYEGINGKVRAGAVHVIYGSPDGLSTATASQFFTEDSAGIADSAEANDNFGFALAAVDLDGDHISDLAIGVPFEGGGEGAVHVLRGSVNGLSGWKYYSYSTFFSFPCFCWFGSSLAWGQFDTDARGDLAIGMPHFYADSGPQTGAIFVRYGDHPAAFHVIEAPSEKDGDFGAALAAGDYDGDGLDELAVGVPGYSTLTIANAGRVAMYSGSASGLLYYRSFDQSDAGGTFEGGDKFGTVMTFGDFDGDGKKELVVGAPYEDLGSSNDAGAVSIFYRSARYPLTFDKTITQDNLANAEGEAGDLFGHALAAADFDGDGIADLAIGAPGEDHGNPNQFVTFIQDAGLVHVLYSSSVTGAGGKRTEIWHQAVSGVPGANEVGDRFGYSLSAWNFGKSAVRDLAIGIPYEDVGDVVDAGAMLVMYGTGSGLSTTGAEIWHQGSTGIADDPETNDRFGIAMY